MHIHPDPLCCPMKHRTPQFVIELGAFRTFFRGQILKHFMHGGTTGSGHAPVTVFQPVDDQISSHPSQPASKGTPFFGCIPAIDIATDRQKQLLHHLLSVRVLQTMSPE